MTPKAESIYELDVVGLQYRSICQNVIRSALPGILTSLASMALSSGEQ